MVVHVDTVDVDECSLSTSDCSPSDDCVNTDGSFECLPRCQTGFRRHVDSLQCLGLSIIHSTTNHTTTPVI